MGRKLRLFVALWLLAAVGGGVAASGAGSMPPAELAAERSAGAALASVGGTIRHNGQPVGGIPVNVIWATGSQVVDTGADGRYAVHGVPTGGWLMIHVWPALHRRLAWQNWSTQTVTGDLVRDWELVSGYVLTVDPLRPDGQPYTQEFWLSVHPLESELPPGQWLGAPGAGIHQLVAAPGVYALGGEVAPYYMPRAIVDLRSGDQHVEVRLLAQPESALPTEPPRADRIAVGAADADGVATVTGSAGAVPAWASVAIVNLNARRIVLADSDASGAFSARLFAPPGSFLWVKYDVDGRYMEELWRCSQPGSNCGDFSAVNPLPGTTIRVPSTGANTGTQHSFASAGAIGAAGYDWAGWWMSGTVSVPSAGAGPGLPIRRGQTVRVTARLSITSPAWSCSGGLDGPVQLHIQLRHLLGADGFPERGGTWFNAHVFTATGLPIENETDTQARGMVTAQSAVLLPCVSAHTVEGTFDVTFVVPNDLPDGTYQVTAWVDTPYVPFTPDVPQPVVWFMDPHQAFGPVLRVGSPATPRLPWVLFTDVPVNGHRGVVARQDAGHYALTPRSVTPPQRAIVPRLDERMGLPVDYDLALSLPWLSSTDRRLPCPPGLPFALPSGSLTVSVKRPDGVTDTLGPATLRQSSVRTPTTPGGAILNSGTGHVGDAYQLTTLDPRFDYAFPMDGSYALTFQGSVLDVYGNAWPFQHTYDVDVGAILDLDPGQLPTTPYRQGDAFSPNLHVFPPVPADVTIKLVQMPASNPAQATTRTITGKANRFGVFQPTAGTDIRLTAAGEFRVDVTAVYTAPNGMAWRGAMTWGGVVEVLNPQMEAHGRRGMDYHGDTVDDMPAWFEVFQLPTAKVGIEVYYPYFNGDIHWGNEDRAPGDSIHSIITVKDLTGSRQTIYNALRANYPRSRSGFRWPPDDMSPVGLEKRIAIGEAPLFISTSTGDDPTVAPDKVDQWGYAYHSSERPDVRVREMISTDNVGTAYWRFDDTYTYQIGEPANGDQPGDIKWEFGGAVLRVPSRSIAEYAIYSSLWVLLPHGDPVGARITPPFQDATGASINGGPILTLQGRDIDMLFLPKGVRPGDVLEVGDVVAFCGHVGPPLDSSVAVTMTSPTGVVRTRTLRASKVGWAYDPAFDFAANEAGMWRVDVMVRHDRPYVGNGVIPTRHNTGTVLGTQGRYVFYVVPKASPRLIIADPPPGWLPWPQGWPGAEGRIQPITIRGFAPPGSTGVHYTIHDKGIVMGQGTLPVAADGHFSLVYDARVLHQTFSMVSLTAHEGMWEGLADEVAINFLSLGATPRSNTVTLIGERVFVGSDQRPRAFLPVVRR